MVFFFLGFGDRTNESRPMEMRRGRLWEKIEVNERKDELPASWGRRMIL